MKTIPLTKDQVAIVDDEDYNYLSQWEWYAQYSKFTNSFYAVRNSKSLAKRIQIRMSRAILGVKDPKIFVDHKNGDTLDNRRDNLRLANKNQNAANKRIARNNTSGVKGVCWHKRDKKWMVRVGKEFIGNFSSLEKAIEARDLNHLDKYGDFARIDSSLVARVIKHVPRENGNLVHGHSRVGNWSATYKTWLSMNRRCNNKNDAAYKDYGGRGIKICERWIRFENFLEDMGERPEGLTLDRENNDLGYYKENCKWATPKEQAGNRRSSVMVSYKDETLCLKHMIEKYGTNSKDFSVLIKADGLNEESIGTIY